MYQTLSSICNARKKEGGRGREKEGRKEKWKREGVVTESFKMYNFLKRKAMVIPIYISAGFKTISQVSKKKKSENYRKREELER